MLIVRGWVRLAGAATCLIAGLAMAQPSPPRVVALRGLGVALDPDDPAIWINRADPRRSLILGTMKVAAPDGALAVFGLDGRLHDLIKGSDRPNNVDVEYGLSLGGRPTDIAILTERAGRRLRAYAIAADGGLRDVSSVSLTSILAGAPGLQGAPMGIGLYRRPRDGAIFAIVAPKAGRGTSAEPALRARARPPAGSVRRRQEADRERRRGYVSPTRWHPQALIPTTRRPRGLRVAGPDTPDRGLGVTVPMARATCHRSAASRPFTRSPEGAAARRPLGRSRLGGRCQRRDVTSAPLGPGSRHRRRRSRGPQT